MKKLLSMLLVLTMVVSTLMGVMVMDVNAADVVSGGTRASVAGDTITLRFDTAKLPVTKLGAMNGFALGTWSAHGYTYAETDIAALIDGTVTSIDGTATDSIEFLKTEVVTNPLQGDMLKYDFKAASLTAGSGAARTYANTYATNGSEKLWTNDGKIAPNYSRISFFPVIDTAAESQTSFNDNKYGWTDLTKAEMEATNTDSTAYVFSFYAYTNVADISDISSTGTYINFELRSGENKSLCILAKDLVSENGIPHKVDIVLAYDGTSYYPHLYVDGIEKTYMETIKYSSAALTLGDTIVFQPRAQITLTSAKANKVADVDWYITNYTSGTSFTAVSRDTVEAGLIHDTDFVATANATTYRTDDYITGVIDSLDADIKTVLETEEVGDKVVGIYESNYNNPASLFTGDATTVKLVSKTTGEEVAVADATGTMDDYYLMVNGIYIKADKILPYYKSDVDPFAVSSSEHQQTVTRVYFENYEDNVMDEDLPALGGLRSGFLKYTATPRGNFSFYNGNIKYGTNDGYRFVPSPQIKLADHGNLAKKLTLEFDMYLPEYEATTSNYSRLLLNGHTDPTVTGTNAGSYGTDMQQIYFTTNGLANGLTSSKYVLVDLVGNAWNSVAIVFDSTDTATDGKYDISVYVNGELQKSFETGAYYADNAAERLCSLNFVRFYTPLYTSAGIMNDAWYAGDYEISATPAAEGVIDADTVTGVEISVDDTNNLIAYDNSSDADYSALIDAMSAAGYQPVYTQVVNVDLLNEKYDEVDGLITTVANEDGTKTITGKLVKKWLDSTYTKSYVVADTSAEVSAYTIKNSNITDAVDNGDGTASITITSKFGATGSYPGIASSYEEIIAALAAEEPARIGRTLELTGFAVTEEGKLPKVYSLAENGLKLRSLGYIDNNAVLTYREFNGTAEDTYTFQIVVGAFNENGKLLALKVDTSKTITGAEADGEKVVTFTPGFTDDVLADTAYYKVFAFETFVGGRAIMPSAKITK